MELRKLRRWLSASEPFARTGVLALHRQRFLSTALLVQMFYGLQLLVVSRGLTRWQGWLELDSLEGALWPIAWSRWTSPAMTVSVVCACYLVSALYATVWPGRLSSRFLVALTLLMYSGLANSFGKIDHGLHVQLLISWLFLLLPNGKAGELAGSVSARQRYLLVFAAGQAMLLLTYTMAGWWKLWYGLQQLSHGAVSVLSPTGFSYLIADRLAQTNSRSVLGPWLIEHPLLAWPVMVAGVYIELCALIVVFRPSLRTTWGILLIVFHLSAILTMTINFSNHIMLCVILLVMAPGPMAAGGATKQTEVATFFHQLPLLGWPLRRAMARRAEVPG